MELNDVLKIGEVCEVSGRMIKAGIYSEKNTEYLNYDGAVIKNVSIGSFVLIRKGFAIIVGKVEGEYIKDNVGIPQDIKRIIGIGVRGAIENEKFVTMGRATPFQDWKLQGENLLTIYKGEIVYEAL